MYQYFMTSPIGKLRLVEDGGFIKEISLADVPAARLNSEGKIIKAAETYVGAATEKQRYWLRRNASSGNILQG